MGMTGREDSRAVRDFFERPDLYLNRNATTLRLRSVIVRELLGSAAGARILDLGCGDGSLSIQFLHEARQLTLLDRSVGMLEVARQNIPAVHGAKVSMVNADLLENAGPPERYDVVLCVGVLAHATSMEEVIALIADLLVPGGRAVVQITDHNQLLTRLTRAYWRLRRRLSTNETRLSSIVDLSSRYGLRLAAIQRYSVVLPGMGHLPAHWLFRYEMFVLRRPALAARGSEILLVLTKET
jgi:ubiquinone/menaquinone biosynthesis C-methylase UbiE